jgi:predicted N-acetyltransferase YhbS
LKDIGKVNKILYFYSKLFDSPDNIIMTGIFIRKETSVDFEAIKEVNDLAFGQNQGIGGELIRAGLKRAKELGFKSVIVLGHPEYYPRFGFRKASEWNIKDPFGAPEAAMMATELEKGSLDFGGGIIEYPEEFYETV